MKGDESSGKSCILIGAGSIGVAHFYECAERFSEIHVVDSNAETLDALRASVSNISDIEVKFFNSICDKNLSSSYDLAIIANWGPGHFAVFDNLIKKNIETFIIEKPISDSLLELEDFVNLYNSTSIKIYVNFTLEFSGLANIIRKATTALGNLEIVNVTGGAKCVATNGIHWLSFASRLFGELPKSTYSSLCSQNINPRSKDFLFLEGSASWFFESGRNINISFSNKSHLALRVDFVFQNGHAVLENHEFRARKIAQNVQGLPFTRTFKPDQEVIKLEDYRGNNSTSPLRYLYDAIFAHQEDNFYHSIMINSALIATLIANEESRKISLPLDSEKISYFSKKWGIS